MRYTAVLFDLFDTLVRFDRERMPEIQVNGRRVNVPSYRCLAGDEVRMAPASKDLDAVAASLDLASKGQTVAWLAVDRDARTGKITERPTRNTIPVAAQEQLIVELYSK